MRAARAVVLMLTAVGAAACGSSRTLADILGPTSNATVTALAINVNPPAIGGTVVATATATFDNGTTSLVPAVFSSDTPAVATIASTTGVATGVALGDVTINAEFQGVRGSKKVRVLPSFSGEFIGPYVVDSCVETGGFETLGLCQAFVPGRTLSVSFQFAQTADLTAVSGTFALGNIVGSQTGSVSTAGELSLFGSVTAGTTSMLLRNFRATSSAPGHMAGHFEQLWTDTTVPGGQGVVSCTLQDTTRGGVLAKR